MRVLSWTEWFAACAWLWLSSGALAQATGDRAVSPREGHKPTAAERAWIPSEWGALTEQARLWNIPGADGKVAVWLLSVSAQDYYAAQPGTPAIIKLPKPLLLLPDGRRVGELPMSFPDEPPATLTVKATRWQGGFPHRLELHVTSDTAAGAYDLPALEWDAKAGRFTALGR
jgi:hypothetical protein